MEDKKRVRKLYKLMRAISKDDESRLTIGLIINSWNLTRKGKLFYAGLYRYRRALEKLLGIDLKFGTSQYGECHEGLSCRLVFKVWKAALATPRVGSYYGKKNPPKNWDRQWFQFLEVWPNHHRWEMKGWLQNKYRPAGI
ncbi:MAG TPA: hypothetical protein PLV82_04545 [bacterium]|nr:hypothetical protein [bacterium]